MVSLLRTLKLSAVERLIDDYKLSGNDIFASFEISNNTHPVTGNLMRDISTVAHKNVDVSRPIRLHGLRFSRVTQKAE